MNIFNKKNIYIALVIFAVLLNLTVSLYYVLTGQIELSGGWLLATFWAIMYANNISYE
jgi:hypothetical protein